MIGAALMMAGAQVTRGEYRVLDLGAMTAANGINSTGQAALTRAPDGTNNHAFRYSAGSFLDLGTLGGNTSSGVGINSAGQVVGRSLTSAGLNHAYVWTPGGTAGVSSNPQMTDLTPSAPGSEADAINASGQIVGYVTETGHGINSTDNAFLYSNGTLTHLPLPAGNFPYSYAYGINDSGKVVGAAYMGQSSSATGFFYTGTKSVVIPDLGGGNTSPAAINNNDRAVGYSTTGAGVDHAFVYSNGATTDLGTLGGHYSYADAINNNNQIVGGSFTDANDSIFHAFVSDGTTMTDLNSLVTSQAAGWVLGEAKGVNDQGLIVGTGKLADQDHAFLLQPLLPGDANADGKVDFSDLLALAQHYNAGGALWEQGDFNGDGTVNFNDLLALAQNYGHQATPASAAPVPEPAGLLTIGLLALTVVRGRRIPTRTGCRASL